MSELCGKANYISIKLIFQNLHFCPTPPTLDYQEKDTLPQKTVVKFKGAYPQQQAHKPTVKMERNTVPENPNHASKPSAWFTFISMKPLLFCHWVHETGTHEVQCILQAFPTRQRGSPPSHWGGKLILQEDWKFKRPDVIRNSKDVRRLFFLFNLWCFF